MIRCVDLFCGIGGLTHGLARAGVDVVAGVDADDACRFAYEQNNNATFHLRDIAEVSGQDIQKQFGGGEITLLAGCAPCQPFSTYNRAGRESRSDSKWSLLSEFGRLIDESEPDLITMENVPLLQHHPVFKGFLRSLCNYYLSYSLPCLKGCNRAF